MIVGVLTACISVVVLNKAMRPVAHRLGLLDIPGGRKRHAVPTPLIGGIVIFLAFCLGLAVGLPAYNKFVYVLLPAAALILMAGVADDLYDLPASWRIMLEIAAVLLVYFGLDLNLGVVSLLAPGVTFDASMLAVPFALVAVVGMINAFNMMDGIDGLSSGVVLVALVGMLCFSAVAGGSEQVDPTVWVLIFAVSTFMLQNLGLITRKKVFLGDSGSMMLGFVVMLMLMQYSSDYNGLDRSFIMSDALWAMAIPLADCLTLIIRRVLKGRHPFSADRTHLHHVLMRMGFGSRSSLVLILGAALVILCFGLILKVLGLDWLMPWAFCVWLAAYIFAMVHAFRMVRAIRPVVRRLKKRSTLFASIVVR